MISTGLSTALPVTGNLNRLVNQDFTVDFHLGSTGVTDSSCSFLKVGVDSEGVVQDKVSFGGSELVEMIGERGRESIGSVWSQFKSRGLKVLLELVRIPSLLIMGTV